jgi:hypothetical protein
MNLSKEQILDQGNCDFVRNRGKAAYIKDVSPRTGTWYKADGMGELAPHSEARGSVSEVNHGVVHRNSAFLPGEASLPCSVWFQPTSKDGTALAAMRVLSSEESAESVVVVSESVSSPRPMGDGEECGQSLRSKARTKEEEATGGGL